MGQRMGWQMEPLMEMLMVQLTVQLMAYCSGRQMARPSAAALVQRAGRQEERRAPSKAGRMMQRKAQRMAQLTVSPMELQTEWQRASRTALQTSKEMELLMARRSETQIVLLIA